MAQAAYCSQCGANVYVGAEGRCPRGHGPESLSNYYEVADSPVAPTVTPGQPATPKKSNTLLIVLVILGVLVLCTVGSCCAALPFYAGMTEEIMQELQVPESIQVPEEF